MKYVHKLFLLIAYATAITMPLKAKESIEDVMSQLVVSAVIPKPEQPIKTKNGEKFVSKSNVFAIVSTPESKFSTQEPEGFVKYIRTILEQATKKAAKRIVAAVIKKNTIQQSYLDGKITSAIRDTKTTQQDDIINTTKQELLKLTVNSIEIADETEKQTSYLGQFLAGVQNLGAKIIAPLKAGYGSQQEKDLAQAVILELENLKKTKIDPKVIKAIDNEIYKQKVITGQELGIQKKLLRGAAVAAAGIAGASLASLYLNFPAESSEISMAPMQQPAPSSEPLDQKDSIAQPPAREIIIGSDTLVIPQISEQQPTPIEKEQLSEQSTVAIESVNEPTNERPFEPQQKANNGVKIDVVSLTPEKGQSSENFVIENGWDLLHEVVKLEKEATNLYNKGFSLTSDERKRLAEINEELIPSLLDRISLTPQATDFLPGFQMTIEEMRERLGRLVKGEF